MATLLSIRMPSLTVSTGPDMKVEGGGRACVCHARRYIALPAGVLGLGDGEDEGVAVAGGWVGVGVPAKPGRSRRQRGQGRTRRRSTWSWPPNVSAGWWVPVGDRCHTRRRARAAAFDFSPIEVLTFDCYGTLVDWESGLLAGLRRVVGDDRPDDELLEAYASAEAEAEAGAWQPYRSASCSAGLRRCAPGTTYNPPTSSRPTSPRRRRLARLSQFGRRTRSAAPALSVGRDHELRRRPFRGRQPAAWASRSTGS